MRVTVQRFFPTTGDWCGVDSKPIDAEVTLQIDRAELLGWIHVYANIIAGEFDTLAEA